MNKKPANKLLIDDVAKDIKKIAIELNIEPINVTKAVYFVSGGKYTEWELRKLGGLDSIKKAVFEPSLEKDRGQVSEVKELRKRFLALDREMGDKDLLMKRISESVSSMPAIKVEPYKVQKNKAKVKKVDQRTLNLVLSDLHFGSDLDDRETGFKWGKEEEARALAKVVQNVCNYKVQYRGQTRLAVMILGDIIQGELHGRTSADLLHIQTCRAIHLLSQAIARFSENFPQVDIYFAVGNHGRDTSFHQTRATALKYNAVETTIYYATKTVCRNLKNVSFTQPKTHWVTYESCGHRVYATHGDTNLNPGNPGNNLNIKGLLGQTNQINASLSDKDEYEVFVCGHVHLPLVTLLPNGATLITNGALVPPDSFAQTLNIMESQQVQVMWESTPEYPVGDKRFINVTGSEKEAELDKIIKPFVSIED